MCSALKKNRRQATDDRQQTAGTWSQNVQISTEECALLVLSEARTESAEERVKSSEQGSDGRE